MATLMWISHSERPLKPDELCHALAVEIGSANLNTDNVPSIGVVLACCQGLVVVDEEASRVRLIHFTLQEYLRAHPELFGTTHAMMAEICLSYLNTKQVKALSTSPSPDFESAPFLEYSSLYWGIYAKKDLSDCAKSLALKLFDDDDYNNHISTKILLKSQGPSIRISGFDKLSQFSGLHCACMFGIVEIVAGLVEVEDCDVNQRDCGGNTALAWAAWNGHEGVAGILLGRDDINPDESDQEGDTPLHCAAFNGHEGVLKMLLGRSDVNPEISDNDGRTPLWIAARDGNAGVVNILLGRDDVNPDRPDNDGRTPLWCAAINGNEAAVKILLGQNDVNPDRPDNEGRTPLSCASQYGHTGVVRLLESRGLPLPPKPKAEET